MSTTASPCTVAPAGRLRAFFPGFFKAVPVAPIMHACESSRMSDVNDCVPRMRAMSSRSERMVPHNRHGVREPGCVSVHALQDHMVVQLCVEHTTPWPLSPQFSWRDTTVQEKDKVAAKGNATCSLPAKCVSLGVCSKAVSGELHSRLVVHDSLPLGPRASHHTRRHGGERAGGRCLVLTHVGKGARIGLCPQTCCGRLPFRKS